MSKDEQTKKSTEPTKPDLYLLRGDATDEEIEDLLDQMCPDEPRESTHLEYSENETRSGS